MRLLQDFLDRSKQHNQTSLSNKVGKSLAYHASTHKYKIIHHALILPNLPPPLHYLNFHSMIGQPNVPIFSNLSAVQTTALNTATVLCSSSVHMVGQLHSYDIKQQCNFQNDHFQFLDREQLAGQPPFLNFSRQDSELQLELDIETTSVTSHLIQLRLGLTTHWSALCKCKGELKYKGQLYHIDALGSFEYARSINFAYLPLAFFCYQVINLANQRQILFLQIRDRFNRVMQSRIYLRDLHTGQNRMFDEDVCFKVHRVYPSMMTPNGQKMYLPREFEWCYVDQAGNKINLQAQSRGDFKFGLAAGYVGSFCYQISIDGQVESGEGGYCEYIDCRALRFQEQNKSEKLLNDLANPVPILLKK